MPRTYPCPKCERTLKVCGELSIDGKAIDVFQCDECVRAFEFDGEAFEGALTFGVTAGGQLVDPESLEPLDLSK